MKKTALILSAFSLIAFAAFADKTVKNVGDESLTFLDGNGTNHTIAPDEQLTLDDATADRLINLTVKTDNGTISFEEIE